MSRLTDLLAQAKARDPQMGADLEREFQALSSRLPFGLNFERHRPEAVELPNRVPRKGDKVRVLPERGSTKKGDPALWTVKHIVKDGATKLANIQSIDATQAGRQGVNLDELIVVAEFRDTIYRGLNSTGHVSRGGDKPCREDVDVRATAYRTPAYRGYRMSLDVLCLPEAEAAIARARYSPAMTVRASVAAQMRCNRNPA